MFIRFSLFFFSLANLSQCVVSPSSPLSTTAASHPFLRFDSSALRGCLLLFLGHHLASPLALPVPRPEKRSHSGFKGRKGDGRETNLAAAGVLLSNQNHPSRIPLCNSLPLLAHRLQLFAVWELSRVRLVAPVLVPVAAASSRVAPACFDAWVVTLKHSVLSNNIALGAERNCEGPFKDIACFRRVAPCLSAKESPLVLVPALIHTLLGCMEASTSAFEAPRGLGIGW
ncbi:hypothetical protein ASPNIDRAFT_42540 [Aspergillus niger ATCC 1015]|uniref:Secreted protein n=1 Tax=Aspergillus niger (strain ATCC 1015 / CBS 113.46 / FGSC A1144 / LSHB Ac4 / NCTC 3858a / NRRL 328 / USDA 3528.7) TaxID=380704 RepID=G3XV56_ASPNA|nr:hypothetical protein ASPNIDRAFT_42540 [Aspergillus niger ATCC 1015]